LASIHPEQGSGRCGQRVGGLDRGDGLRVVSGLSETVNMSTVQDNKFKVDLAKGEQPPKGFVRGRNVALACIVFVVVLGGINITSTIAGSKRDARRANDKALTNSSAVTQTFTDIEGGITQTFTAKEVAGVPAVQRYTEELLIVRRNVGDYGVDDVKDLTGRENLEANIEDLVVTRSVTERGATMTFTSKKSELVAELRKWAKAVVADRSRRGL
jgi:hypothetical protein